MSVLRRRQPKQPESARRQQFEALVLPQLDALYRVALALVHNREEAEDLVQETCLRAYRAFERFDGQHCRAWMFTILRHTHISRWRHNGHGQQTVTIAAETGALSWRALPADQSAEEAVLAHVFAEDLERALACLPDESRLMLLLAYVEEVSYAEIAEVMDCPIGTVMSRLHRARRTLEELLAPTRVSQASAGRK